ncbi:hypothetical protein CDAR_371521 [Caerostris darwini]|uniref:Uncharacterized protein n=1 Tax=Caerostris darwini TaxID=1538125 RepID=A0AAV4XBF4_9ARAC|nr:hypothetical protein CDAR_371521 [Caerostris darwini]
MPIRGTRHSLAKQKRHHLLVTSGIIEGWKTGPHYYLLPCACSVSVIFCEPRPYCPMGVPTFCHSDREPCRQYLSEYTRLTSMPPCLPTPKVEFVAKFSFAPTTKKMTFVHPS